MAAGAPRVAVTELITSPDVLPALQDTGYDIDRAIATVTRLAATLRRQFKFDEDETPMALTTGGVKISNLAGVLRLAPGVEIDIAPKFLGHTYAGWRDDWLAIANLTGHGRILSSHIMRGAYGRSSDLASLIGRTFVAEFHANQRRPLRVYQRRTWTDWVIDGELDLDALTRFDLDGFAQTAVVLDRANPFNAVIRAAADALLREVRDPVVRTQLARIRDALPPSGTVPSRLPAVPSRHRAWAPLVQLAQQILAGFDVTLTPPAGKDDAKAPGFLVRTWQAWERLVFVALRRIWNDQRVKSQEEHAWALRGSAAVMVKPDTSIHAGMAVAPIDAKYKTRIDLGRRAIAMTDLMEASAFIDASGSDSIVLLYPRLAEAGIAPLGVGECKIFDRVEVGPKVILGVEVEVRGIGKPNGYADFAERLASQVEGLHPALGPGTMAP